MYCWLSLQIYLCCLWLLLCSRVMFIWLVLLTEVTFHFFHYIECLLKTKFNLYYTQLYIYPLCQIVNLIRLLFICKIALTYPSLPKSICSLRKPRAFVCLIWWISLYLDENNYFWLWSKTQFNFSIVCLTNNVTCTDSRGCSAFVLVYILLSH